MTPEKKFIGAALMALLAIHAVSAQRTSPQFSFPPPGAIASQFGADVFGPNSALGQELGQPSLVQIGASPQPAQQVQQASQQQQQQSQPQSQPQSSPSQSQSGQGGADQSAGSSQAAPSGLQLSRPRPAQPAGSSATGSSVNQQHQLARHHSQTAGVASAVAAPSHVSSTSAQRSSSTNHQHGHSAASHGAQSQNQHSQAHNKLHTQQTSQAANSGSQQAAIEAARKAEATAASLAATSGQTYHCPDSFGFFRHHKSCDKYWACENGTSTLKLCGNGLMFDDSDPKRENCAYPFSVDCGPDRTDLEPPISTPHCPRLYGLFADTANCRVFYSCWNGEASKYECPPGLAYDNEQRVCVWADLVDRCDQSEVSDGFVCPDPSEVDQPGHYTRHAHPTDCRKFYVCIEGVARPYGCSLGTVFNVDSLQCDEPENVSGCEKYYGEPEPKLAKKLAREGAQQLPPAQAAPSSRHTASSPSASH